MAAATTLTLIKQGLRIQDHQAARADLRGSLDVRLHRRSYAAGAMDAAARPVAARSLSMGTRTQRTEWLPLR